MSTRPAPFAVLLALGCAHAAAPVKPPPDLPVSRVILYQNGVGYFERRGNVEGGSVDIRVRPDQINDVLKSLTVIDLAGGSVSSVSLPVERTADNLAAELPKQVRDASGLQGLLPVLRGAPVQVWTKDGSLSGRVVGVEQGPPPEKDRERENRLTLMTDAGELVTVGVGQITRLAIGDGALSAGLARSLEISRGEGSWKPVTLTLHLSGGNVHDVVVSYIHEVPIWRPAYRAWVESEKKVRLQGWAVVDNVSGEPWNEVKLGLAVGAPLSFRYDLHTPRTVRRPDLTSRQPELAEAPPPSDVGYEAAPPPPAMQADSAPPASEWGEAKAAAPSRARRPSAAPRPMAMDLAAPAFAGRAEIDEQAKKEAINRSAAALVTGREVGALYTYESIGAVTVPDGSAALINIVNREVEGEDVFLFRDPATNASPLRAVLLRNGNDASLEAGPITLYVDGTFAGEGMIARVGKGETVFVPYAKEGGFAMNLKTENQVEELHLAKIIDGRITLQGRRIHTRRIGLESNRTEESRAYVKLTLIAGTELVDPPKDLVRSGGDVFVPLKVPAKGKAEVAIVEQSKLEVVDAGLSDRVLDAFRFYVAGRSIEEAVAGPIRELLKGREEKGRLDRENQRLVEQREVLARENQRVEESLSSLPVSSAAAAPLRKQLLGQMEKLAVDSAEVARKLVENGIKLAALAEKEVQLLRGISLK